jgi:surface polysaccharide O-acyltransferase-like enzyme
MSYLWIFQALVFAYIIMNIIGFKNVCNYKHPGIMWKVYGILCVVGLFISRLSYVLHEDYPLYSQEYIQCSFLILVGSLACGIISYIVYKETRDRSND